MAKGKSSLPFSLNLLLVQALFIGSIACLGSKEEAELPLQSLKDLKLDIVVHYNSDKPKGFGLRGSALGLKYNESLEMQSVGESTWKFTVVYQQTKLGFAPNDATSFHRENTINYGQKLEVIVYLMEEDGAELKMKNQVYQIDLPRSRSSAYVSSTMGYVNTKDLYPFFFLEHGEVVKQLVTSDGSDAQDEELGERSISVYKPPGLLENPQPFYKSFILIDYSSFLNAEEFFTSALNKMFANGMSEEFVAIGYGDWKDDSETPIFRDRFEQLAPTNGPWYECKEGNYTNLCNFCVKDPINALLYYLTEGGCGKRLEMKGKADLLLDYLLNNVVPAVHASIQESHPTILSDKREHRGVVGMSMGGLFSCYAAFTRPQIFGMGGCASSSFWWPIYHVPGTNATTLNDFNNIVLAEQNQNGDNVRPYQKIVIDVAEKEVNSGGYEMLKDAMDVLESLDNMDAFKENYNLWLEVYPGLEHLPQDFAGRFANIFEFLLGN